MGGLLWVVLVAGVDVWPASVVAIRVVGVIRTSTAVIDPLVF